MQCSRLVSPNITLKNNSGTNHTNNSTPLAYLKQNFRQTISPIKLKHVTTHDVNKIIHSLKGKDSHGYDEISTRILKTSAPYILSPLTYITNKILLTGIFPDRLKFSEVKPVLKKGEETEFSNYRPISLLTSFSKIIEKIIYKQLYRHLKENNVLVKEQFGFREESSTDMATYALLNAVLSSLDRKHIVGSVFCDLQKAFDCVNHNILLTKLDFYGISNTANQLIKSYLNHRYQRVIIKDTMNANWTSDWEPIKHGVPQGSILGPLLFLIYINDLPQTINRVADPVLFADDTSIVISHTNLEEFKSSINLVLEQTANWFRSNFLSLNFNKTHFLQFSTKTQKENKIQIITTNSIITNTNSTKFLGLTIDSTLSWRDHISCLTSKLTKACYAIRTIKPFVAPNTLRTVYYSYFHSVMSYGVIFWGNSHLSNNIFKIQKRIIRIITNKGKRDSCRNLYKQLQILTLPSQYIFSLLLFVAKHRDLFLSNSEIHNINTRFNYNLHLPTTNLTLVQKGVLYSGSRIYNQLPTYIKDLSTDLKRYKAKLRAFLLEHTCYSIEEFYQITSKSA